MTILVCNPCRVCGAVHKALSWEQLAACLRRQVDLLREAIEHVTTEADTSHYADLDVHDLDVLREALRATADPGATQLSGPCP